MNSQGNEKDLQTAIEALGAVGDTMTSCYDCDSKPGTVTYFVPIRWSGQEDWREVRLCHGCAHDRDVKDAIEAEYQAERRMGA